MPDILTADTVPSVTTLKMTGNQLEVIPMGLLELPRLKVRVTLFHRQRQHSCCPMPHPLPSLQQPEASCTGAIC